MTPIKGAIHRFLLRISLLRKHRANPSGSSNLALFDPYSKHRTVLVTHIGASHDSLKTVIEETEVLRAVCDRVVYITDYPDTLIMREHGCIFEYLPSRELQERHAPHAPWSDFLRDRYTLLIAKWQPLAVIAFGESFEKAIARANLAEVAK
jgi:hypothetical protein